MASKRSPLRVSWWDRFLIGVAPSWGLSRVRARAATATLARHFDATSTGRRASGWNRKGSDANAANANSIATLRDLSRDLRRNNAWAKRGVQAITNNAIGWGIMPKATSRDPELARAAIDLWKRWANSSRCDYDGQLPFTGLQRLVMDTVIESGEALVVRQPAGAADGLPVPLRLQVLEPDYIDTTKTGAAANGNPIIEGIEFSDGRRVAYWLFTNHPGSLTLTGGKFESQRVAADAVLHIYRVDRPGQVRGVPWLATAITRLHDFDDYEDAALMQQKIAACFGAFVQDYDGAGSALGEQDEDDETIESLEPGHIAYLPPGKTVTFATPPAVTDAAFTTRNLRRIAAGLGVTYEDLTGDYSQVNFSSARMARLAHWANVHDWRWNMIIPQLCDGVWRWVMSQAAALHDWPSTPGAEWAPPPMPMLEPEKEGLAYTRLVRAGAMTLPQMIRERGEDPEQHLQEIAEYNARLDQLGIWLDSDPRRTSAAGLTQERPGGGAASGEE